MIILKFTGNLVDTMGDNARGDFEKDLGLKFHNGHQNIEEGITLLEVIDEQKAEKYINHKLVEVLDENQANQLLISNMDKIVYKKYDDALYGANINHLIGLGTLNIDELLPVWTDQQELDFLYNKGISGINKKQIIVEKFQAPIIQEPEEPVAEEPITEEPAI